MPRAGAVSRRSGNPSTAPQRGTMAVRAENGSGWEFAVRPYHLTDRDAAPSPHGERRVRAAVSSGSLPEVGEYRADGLTHCYDLEPESCFVAEVDGAIVGNLLGTVDARLAEERQRTFTRALHRRRMLRGVYGVPLFLIPVLRTDRAPRPSEPPSIDPALYPAELRIGVDRAWRGTTLGAPWSRPSRPACGRAASLATVFSPRRTTPTASCSSARSGFGSLGRSSGGCTTASSGGPSQSTFSCAACARSARAMHSTEETEASSHTVFCIDRARA